MKKGTVTAATANKGIEVISTQQLEAQKSLKWLRQNKKLLLEGFVLPVLKFVVNSQSRQKKIPAQGGHN